MKAKEYITRIVGEIMEEQAARADGQRDRLEAIFEAVRKLPSPHKEDTLVSLLLNTQALSEDERVRKAA